MLLLNHELRDKEEAVTDMLMGANQLERRCGKYQSVCSWTGTCTVSLGRQTRQHRCVKEMTSVTLKRHRRKEADTLLEELITHCQ